MLICLTVAGGVSCTAWPIDMAKQYMIHSCNCKADDTADLILMQRLPPYPTQQLTPAIYIPKSSER